MRLLTLLLLSLLCTCARAQEGHLPTRIDTVEGPQPGYVTYRFITDMPGDAPLPKAEMFMRGLTAADAASGWDRLDSIVILDPDGQRVALEKPVAPRSEKQLPPVPFAEEDFITIDGRAGQLFHQQLTFRNPTDRSLRMDRKDATRRINTMRPLLELPTHGKAVIVVNGRLQPGAETGELLYANADSLTVRVRFSFRGHDLYEGDFVSSREEALLAPLKLPAGRETLYLRLESTEKLMTIFRDGSPYSKVAVGRQLDEVSVVGLAPGVYLLEITDLGTGEKRYHGLRR